MSNTDYDKIIGGDNGLGGLIRLLMYLLRHDTSESLKKDKDGYVKLADLVAHSSIKKKDTIVEDINTIISQNTEKGVKMFEIKGSGDSAKIKAFGKDEAVSRRRGSRKTGKSKTGSRKTGSRKTGSRKTGSRKTGSRKTGSRKTGSRKTGSRKSRKSLSRRRVSRKGKSRRTGSLRKSGSKKRGSRKRSSKSRHSQSSILNLLG